MNLRWRLSGAANKPLYFSGVCNAICEARNTKPRYYCGEFEKEVNPR